MHLRSFTGSKTTLCAIVCCIGSVVPCATGAELTALQLGLKGTGKVGKWLPVHVAATGLPAGEEVELRTAFSDPSGDICVEIAASGAVSPNGTITLDGCFRPGRLEGTGVVSISKPGVAEPLLKQFVSHGTGLAAPNPEDAVQTTLTLRKLDTQTLLTFGSMAGIEELLRNALAYSPKGQILLDGVSFESPGDLPARPEALESVDVILIADNFAAAPEQSAAVREWVRAGGRLIVSVAKDVAAYLETDLGRWTNPLFEVAGEPVTVRDLTSLQSFVSGASRLETNRAAWPMAVMKSSQISRVVQSLRGPVIGSHSYGSGVVTLVAVDVNKKPVSQWKSLPQFYEVLLFGDKLAGEAAEVARTSRISQSGVSDLATQMLATVDAGPASGGWSTWAIMAIVAGYLTLIGPIDYLIVTRLLKKPHMTWITFPLMIIAGAALLTMPSDGDSGRNLNQLHVVDVLSDRQQQSVRTRSWMSLSTADTMRINVVASAAPEFVTTAGQPEQVLLSWSGRPEDVYGGMYRTGGIGLGRQSYQHDHRSLQSLSSVPMLTSGSRGLYAEWSQDLSEEIVSSELAASGYGLLRGEFHHNLSAPLTDWVLVYGNRVYRPEPASRFASLDPEENCDTGTGEVYTSDLKAYLCGSRIVRNEAAGRSSRGSTQVVTPYDARSTDENYIMTMASFYNVAGGSKYVGLSQTQLRMMELSDTIKLNHAVLIGLTDPPATSLAAGETPIEAARSRTIVRLFLPVDRRPPSDMARTKEDLEKEGQQKE